MADSLPDVQLPETAQLLLDALGAEATVAIIRHWPGVRLYVPKRLADTNPLVTALGREAAEALVASFGGESLIVPKCDQLVRYQQVQQLAAAGESPRAIALAAGYSERHVYKILAELRQASCQLRWDF